MRNNPYRLLAIEDNQDNFRLLKLILDRDCRFTLDHAASLQEGLQKLAQMNYRLVLLDLCLPDSEGLDTLHRFVQERPDVPCIVLTGLSDEQLALEALREGAEDYLLKGSSDLSQISRSIEYALERYHWRCGPAVEGQDLGVLPDHGQDRSNDPELVFELGERVKELRALHRLTMLLQARSPNQDQLLRSAEEILASGFLYPDQVRVHIHISARHADESHHPFRRGSLARISAPLGEWGWLEAAYYKPHESGQQPRFLVEEKHLLNTAGILLSRYLGDKTNRLALQSKTDRLSRAVRGAADAIWDWDLITGAVWCAPRFKEMLGLETAEYDGHIDDFFQVLHPEDQDRVRAKLEAHFAVDQPYEAEFRMQVATGQYRWFRSRGCCERDATGRPIRMAGAIYDINDLVLSEQLCRHLASIVQSSADAILSKDMEGNILSWNRAASQIYGYTASEVIGKSIQMLVPEERRDEDPRLMARLRSGRNIENFETVRRAKDGRMIDVSLSMSPIIDDDGRIIGVSCVHRDVTERNASRRELEEKDRQIRQKQKLECIGALAGGVAHEFNNLLQAILGYTRFALEEVAADSQCYADLREAIAAADRASSLTKQLLQFSRRDEMKIEVLDVNRLIFDLTRIIRPLIGEHIEISLHPGEELPQLTGDSAMLRQVLLNLCLNARDAMPHGGRIGIYTTGIALTHAYPVEGILLEPGDYLAITVRDNGLGIPAQVRDRIFEPFFTTKEVGHGTGLGLSMVYGVLERHGGGVELWTEEGRGTGFTVYLPVSLQTAQAPAEGERCDGQDQTATILLAEDESAVREVARRILERAGHRVILACDGQEAIEQFASAGQRIDLAILDVVMPRLSGREAYQSLRAMAPHLKVIFCSGYAPDLDFSEFLAENDLMLVEKPFEPENLRSAVRIALSGGTLCVAG